MTQTLQDALLKVGLISKDKLKKAEEDKKAAERAKKYGPQGRPESRPSGQRAGAPRPAGEPSERKTPEKKPHFVRPPAPPVEEKKKPTGFIEGKHHHHIRTFCDACGRSSPDVEYYEHKDKRLDKYWLCVKCADDNSILDDYRQTMQSSHAIKGLFRRNYGRTKVFKRA